MKDSLCVCIVDDDPYGMLPITTALERRGLEVCRFASAEQLLASAAAERAGCLVLDIQLPGISGLDLQAELLRRGCQAPAIVISGSATVPDTIRAFEHGARAFFEKPFGIEDLAGTIARAVAAETARRLADDDRRRRLSALSEREREVLDQLVAGKSVKSIGRLLGISPSTAEKHRANVLAKTGFENLIDLTRFMCAPSTPAPAMEKFAMCTFDPPARAPNPHHGPGFRRYASRV